MRQEQRMRLTHSMPHLSFWRRRDIDSYKVSLTPTRYQGFQILFSQPRALLSWTRYSRSVTLLSTLCRWLTIPTTTSLLSWRSQCQWGSTLLYSSGMVQAWVTHFVTPIILP
jgi:hypothetical protein